MKFSIVALDYDGTIAMNGALDSAVRTAIEELRGKGIIAVLVTGRVLRDLRRCMGDLRLFDAVVAENGAVVAFPNAGRSLLLGHPPKPEFLQELTRRGLTFTTGECVVEADAGLATQILSVVKDLELPLALLFNRGRLMILPQAISKATGLRQALRTLRLSEHNTIAVGDAENDHELLEACEIGLAVGWGSPALKAAADGVIDGNGPTAVADYIRRAAGQPKLSPGSKARHRLLLGTREDGQPLSLAVRGRNVLVAGDSQTGKSWVAGLLCEQLVIQHYCVCVIDPEGDYRTLEGLPGVIVLGGDDPPPTSRDITRILRFPDVSVVIDLSRMRLNEKHDYVGWLLLLLAKIRRETGLPHRIVVDEAHYFLHGSDVTNLLDVELAGYTLVTYQVSSLPQNILSATDAIVVTRESDPREVAALRIMQSGNGDLARWQAVLGNLALNEAVLLPKTDEACGELCNFYVAPRLTVHTRHEHKYLDVPLPEAKAFIFTVNGARTGRRARTLKEFTGILASASPDILDSHLRNGDFSRWIADVFRDNALAGDIRQLESQYRIGQVPDANDALIRAIHDHYDLARNAERSGVIDLVVKAR